MATPKQIAFYNELIAQGREPGAKCRLMGDINGADAGKAWHCIGELLGKKGDASVEMDDDFNNEMVNEYSFAEKNNFDADKMIDNKNDFTSFQQVEQYLRDENIIDAQAKFQRTNYLNYDFDSFDEEATELEDSFLSKNGIEYYEDDDKYAEFLKDEGYFWDNNADGYYTDKTDYNKYKNDIVQYHRNQEYLKENALKETELINALKLGEDGVVNLATFNDDNEPLKKELSKQLGVKITTIDYITSNTTTSEYLTLETDEGDEYKVGIGDHYINDGIHKLDPGEIGYDQKYEQDTVTKIGAEKGGTKLKLLMEVFKDLI